MARDGRKTLMEYLGRAREEERRIESALAAHLVMASRPAYQKKLERHLEATKLRGSELEKRIRALGGTVSRGGARGTGGGREVRKAAKRVADRAVELAEGPVEKLRRDTEAATLLENARADYAAATAQAGNYTVVRALARAAGDKGTGRLAKSFRAEHEEMAEYVRKLIPKLSKATVAAEKNGATAAATPKPRAKRASTTPKRAPARPRAKAVATTRPAAPPRSRKKA
jgi:ferritin-like metal-binding protein YciE